MTDRPAVEEATGRLFGDLWHRYDSSLFEESVRLFEMRARANGFDLGWLRGKRALDAGCGGGRYTVAIARQGAAEVIGCDISGSGLEDARRRVAGIPTIRFEQGSVLDLPFPAASFDFVWCAGVLHHTPDPRKGLAELVRVLRPGGRLFLLLYGKGGLRWPTMMAVRPCAQSIGYERVDAALREVGLPANKQRTFLDDLFVPCIAFYDPDEVRAMLAENGIARFERWTRGRLDHEQSAAIQRAELEQLRAVFAALAASGAAEARAAEAAVADAIARLDRTEADLAAGRIDEAARDRTVHGWGHHRIMAEKEPTA